MTFSIQEYTGDGTTTDFAITFDYLDATHVRVAIDGVPTTNGGSLYSFSFVNSTTVRIVKISDGTSAPDVGAAIKVSRQTPITDPPVVWPEGASLTTRDLNKLADYLTFSLQESLDANEGSTLATAAAEAAEASAVAAAASVGAASTSAGAASTSASAAATSAGTASTASAAAIAAQGAAEAALDEFTDLYLGAKASAPTLDNDGDALQSGAQYFNTVTLRMNIYNGSSWSELVGNGGKFYGENGTVGTGAGDIFRSHENTLNSNVTIPSGENAIAAGPLTVASGITLTVSSGGNLVIA